MQGDDQPVYTGLNEEMMNDIFTADEIDRMEAILLDDMNPEELETYRNRIIKTLKEIRTQERLWKQRTNILLDMKEEAECLLRDMR